MGLMDVTEIGRDQVEVAVDARVELGEGPLWDEHDGVLWWVDINAGHVHRFDPATGQDRFFEVDQTVGAVALRKAGSELVLAGRHGFLSFDPALGLSRPIAPTDEGQGRLNDGYCDPRGRFWAGTMGDDDPTSTGTAKLYRLDPDGTVNPMLGGVRVSNGIDWSPDECTMYFADTPTGRIDAFDYEVETGTIGNRRTLITIPQDEGGPDGLVLDADGHLWVALWGGWQIRRYSPEGELEARVHLPVSLVTKGAFGGPALDDLYVTSARVDLSEEQLGEQPHAGSLFRVRTGVRGRMPFRFAG
jgi:sugar lactone lactonase YvrE